MTTNVNLLADLENLGGAGYRGADRIRMLDAEVLELETQLAAGRWPRRLIEAITRRLENVQLYICSKIGW
jgi:hypothetical protein